jgi:leucyl-tRNA synthetase
VAAIDARWPQPDARALVRDVIELVVQVNGKLRARIHVPAGAGQEDVQRLAQADENVARHIEGRTIRKIIVVPGKLVNIVVVEG